MKNLPGGSDTIVAQATSSGRSALAVIRLSGPEAHRIAASLLLPWHSTPRRAFLSTLRDASSGKRIDQGMVTVYAAPASYTGEDMVELSLHGGEIGPALAINALIASGARPALPGELTRRALLNGKLDLLQAEAVADLIDSRSRAMHDIALTQLSGHLSSRLSALREEIIHLEALLAYDVDFPEEDDGPVASTRITQSSREILSLIEGLLATAVTGEMIRSGASIVIAGAPNAGKSSLFNALVGTQRAIVTDIPGTTRDALEAVMDFGSWPVRLVDTAGLRESSDLVERLGIEAAERQIANAAVVLACGENVDSLTATMSEVNRLSPASLIAVGTKDDLGQLPPGTEVTAAIRKSGLQLIPSYVAVSARSGEGLGALMETTVGLLNRFSNVSFGDSPIITRERHRLALERARAEVALFVDIREQDHKIPATIAVVHLQTARSYLEELIGVLDVEEVLDRVFSTFCVGK